MKKPIPSGSGLALTKSLYGSGKELETVSKLANSDDIYNILHPRPSIIPGVEYPITEREERLLDLSWQHAIKTEVCRG